MGISAIGGDIGNLIGELQKVEKKIQKLERLKFQPGEEVILTQGINQGKLGTIQSVNGKVVQKENSYGVDVFMDNGRVMGLWIPANHKTSEIRTSFTPIFFHL